MKLSSANLSLKSDLKVLGLFISGVALTIVLKHKVIVKLVTDDPRDLIILVLSLWIGFNYYRKT